MSDYPPLHKLRMTNDAKHDALVAYLLACVEERDWHGVSDAANDLRVLEARYPQFQECGRVNFPHEVTAPFAPPAAECVAYFRREHDASIFRLPAKRFGAIEQTPHLYSVHLGGEDLGMRVGQVYRDQRLERVDCS